MCKTVNIEAARAALARSAWTRGQPPAYDEDAVTDLLADLRHLCAAAGLDFEYCDRAAATHFEAEIGSES